MLDVLTFTVTLVVAIPVVEWMRDAWRAGPGNRRHVQRQVEQLSAGVLVDHFVDLLGPPASVAYVRDQGQMHRAGDVAESVFVSPWCFVQAIWGLADRTVDRFAVVARHRRFRPRLELPIGYPTPTHITLGKTRFADWPHVGEITTQLGANTGFYVEEFYFGRPGNYLRYQLAVNPFEVAPRGAPAGISWARRRLGRPVRTADMTEFMLRAREDEREPAELAAERWAQQLRSQAVVRTYGESRSSWQNDPFHIGPLDLQILSTRLATPRGPIARTLHRWRRWRSARRIERMISGLE